MDFSHATGSNVINYSNGTGQGYSNSDQADLAMKNLLAGKSAKIDYGPALKGPVEPSVLSTDAGWKNLNQHIEDHNQNMAAVKPPDAKAAPGVTNATDKSGQSTATDNAMKQVGGVTAEEAQAAGIDLSAGYSYDQGSGYYLPSGGTAQQQNNFAQDKQKADDAFSGIMSKLDANSAALTQSIRDIYADRINRQVDINNREYAGFSTLGMRDGTTRYAGGVQQSILTGEENAGLDRIAQIQNEMAGKLTDAQSALDNKEYSAFIDHRNEVDKLKSDYKAEVKDLQDKALAAQKQQKQDVKDEQDYKLNVDKFNETKDQDAFDKAFRLEQQRIDRFKAGMDGANGVQGDIQSATMGADNKPDPTSQASTLYGITKKYGPMTAVAIKGLTDYTMNPADWRAGAAKGMSRADAVTLAKMVDPTYDDKMYPTRASYLRNLTSGPMAQGIVSANKAINHLVTFADTVSKLNNTSPINAANRLNQAITSPFSPDMQTNVTTANTVKSGLKDELAKFFKGTGTTDIKSIDDWGNNLDVGENAGKLKGTVQGAIDLFAGQLGVMSQQYRSTMGRDPEGSILQPQTVEKLSELKNQGYKVDIPGVYFTDPVAYTKASPDNVAKLNSVRADHPDLTPAQATQLAQYLQEHGQ